MDGALREAVAHSHEPETVRLLGSCWEALSQSKGACSAIKEYCQKFHHISDELVSVRLYRNACVRIATARAAVEAKRAIQDAGAVGNLVHRLCEGSSLFDANAEEPPVSRAWSRLDPADLTRQACAALTDRGARMNMVLLWTLDLLNAADSEILRSIRVPVAGCDGKEGFLLNLRLSLIRGSGKELVEHPEMALGMFGKAMLETLDAIWQDARIPVRWELRVRDKKFSALVLDGSSLGGAVAVGLRVLRDGLPYDPSCLIVAQVEGGNLAAVGQEKEKLEAALNANFRRAVVGSGTKIRSLIPDYAARGLEVRELDTIPNAVEFASGQLMELHRVLEVETKRVLDDAAIRIRDRTFRTWNDLDALFVDVKVARGLRPRLTQTEYEQLERQRREGQHRGLDGLAWRRRNSDGDGKADLREERFQAELRRITVYWEQAMRWDTEGHSARRSGLR